MLRINKGFANPITGEIIYDNNQSHDIIAIKICIENNYKWDAKGYVSAADYLVQEKYWIKISNYGSPLFRYLGVATSARQDKSIQGFVKCLSNILKLKIEEY